MKLRNPKKMIIAALLIIGGLVFAMKKGWVKNPFAK